MDSRLPHPSSDLQKIGLRIASHNSGIEFTFIFKHNFDLIRIFRHMIVGDDKAVLINEKSGT